MSPSLIFAHCSRPQLAGGGRDIFPRRWSIGRFAVGSFYFIALFIPQGVELSKCELNKNSAPILDKLNLAAYKQTTIIEMMNPNLGFLSAALHERLQPKQHILLEPEGEYGDRMREFQKKYKNSWYVPLDGYNWDTYSELFSKDLPPPPWPDKFRRPDIRTTLSSEDVNTDLLFVRHLGKSTKSRRLVAQFISCYDLRS